PTPAQYAACSGDTAPLDRALAPPPQSAAGCHQMVPETAAPHIGDASDAALAGALSAATCGPERGNCENGRNRPDSRVSSCDRMPRENRCRLTADSAQHR